MNQHLSFFAKTCMCILVIGACARTSGQWSHDPKVNNPISTAASYQGNQTIISDDAGGAIMTWADYRSGNYDVYAQRIDRSGRVKWTVDGLPIANLPNKQVNPTIVSDGSGGAIIAWQDSRNDTSDIYAQRVNAAGAVLWTADGIPISTQVNGQEYPIAVSDGRGGAIIAWSDTRSGNYDIYAQRVDGSGAPRWTAGGVPVSTASNDQFTNVIASDDNGGAIIAWYDTRAGANTDVYAQRIDSSGTVQWTTDGVAISTATDDQYTSGITSDGLGGAIITWYDNRSGSYDIYAQRVSSLGEIWWTTDGKPVSTATGYQYGAHVVSDGVGGCIIAWQDGRNGYYDIYAQRLNPYGTALWTADGVPVVYQDLDQLAPAIVSDGNGGAIIAYQDIRTGSYDIYAQGINSNGQTEWAYGGIPVSTAGGHQMYPAIVSDGMHGAIVTWEDQRGVSDIYAQNIDRYGVIGDASPQIVKVKDVINDQGGKVTIMWKPSYLDGLTSQTVVLYSIYRGVKPSAVPASGIALRPEEYDKLSTDAQSRTYLKLACSSASADTIYWENIGGVYPDFLEGYSFNATTLSDSGPQGVPQNYYMVRARSWSSAFWNSNIDSGYSLDNLPPGAVAFLSATAQPGPVVKLHWPADVVDPDVGYYELHRSAIPGFMPGPSTKISQASDTTIDDVSPLIGVTNYYRIVTVDVHGNRSLPSPEASTMVTGVDAKEEAIPRQFALEQNFPNPFNPSTVIRYQLPVFSYVTLKIYDVLGKEIATLVDDEQAAGYKSVVWDSRGLPSGLYFYTIRAGSFREMRSMVVVK